MRSIPYMEWSIPNYMNTLDRLVFVNVEVRAASYGFLEQKVSTH